ncbi:MAG: S-methyl-5-thioribose-1-phosphate isomerase [Bacillota bacterium]
MTPLRWEDGGLMLLDQRKLPKEETWMRLETVEEAARAIRDMVVRGAPAIGLTAAYAMALSVPEGAGTEPDSGDELSGVLDRETQQVMNDLFEAARILEASRPTAANLFWATRRQLRVASDVAAEGGDIRRGLLREALRMHEDDVEGNRHMGKYGAALLHEGDRVLTHCNAGALATGGYGTALGVIRAAFESGLNIAAYATETRPYLQGARLTTWELVRDGIPVRLLVDSAAGFLMAQGEIDVVVTGADRIASNGDVANKIGTYQLALAARANDIPFYVAAPISTLDFEIPDGEGIEIEARDGEEITHYRGERVVPEMVEAVNYAFDVTPADLITAIITERGVVRPPFARGLSQLIEGDVHDA